MAMAAVDKDFEQSKVPEEQLTSGENDDNSWLLSAMIFDENSPDENDLNDKQENSNDGDNDSSSFLKNNIRSQASHDCSYDDETHYNRRKPRWWRQRSGKATKSQRAAIQSMKKQDLFLERPAYGECIDWNTVFARTTDTNNNKNQEVWLEIGFGAGDNLLCLAQDYPDIDFVGAEVHGAGLGKVCQHIQRVRETGKPYAEFTRYVDAATTSHSEVKAEESPPVSVTARVPLSNVRLYGGDGVGLLDYIPSDSLSAILLTFPDPFAKASEQEWRIIQGHTLQLIVDKLRKPCDLEQPDASRKTKTHRGNHASSTTTTSTTGGRFYLATDHPVYYDWTHTMIEQRNRVAADAVRQREGDGLTTTPAVTDLWQLVVQPCPDRRLWLPVISAYEKKGGEAGRRTRLSCWQVVARKHNQVVEESTLVEQMADS